MSARRARRCRSSRRVAFQMQAGQGLGLIGPSASGKSTLARALVGVWPTLRGEVRLDGATLDQWEPDALGRHIGYLPQDVELFDGTVAENIARFQPEPEARRRSSRRLRPPARTSMILQLPEGYDTRIGEGGATLSGGQRQRVALARALFGDPFLVVLDEPNASLDGAGDEALNKAILAVRQRGGVVVVITHRPAALGNVDLVGIMEAGRIKALGPRDEVLQSVMKRNAAAPPARQQPRRGDGQARPCGRSDNVGNRRQGPAKPVDRTRRPCAGRRSSGLRSSRCSAARSACGRRPRRCPARSSPAASSSSIPTSRRCSIRPAASSASCACARATASRKATF